MTYLILTHLHLLRLVPLRARDLAGNATRLLSRARIALIGLVLSLAVDPSAVYACEVCVGDPNDPQSKGASSAVLLLMGVTGAVLSCFVAFFGYLWWRARRPLEPVGASIAAPRQLPQEEPTS